MQAVHISQSILKYLTPTVRCTDNANNNVIYIVRSVYMIPKFFTPIANNSTASIRRFSSLLLQAPLHTAPAVTSQGHRPARCTHAAGHCHCRAAGETPSILTVASGDALRGSQKVAVVTSPGAGYSSQWAMSNWSAQICGIPSLEYTQLK